MDVPAKDCDLHSDHNGKAINQTCRVLFKSLIFSFHLLRIRIDFNSEP